MKSGFYPILHFILILHYNKIMGNNIRNGGDGTTGIIGGQRLAKDHPLMECLGTIDELNAFLGDAKSALSEKNSTEHTWRQVLDEIQKDLGLISGIIAGNTAPAPNNKNISRVIAEIKSLLPPLNGFTTPGVNPVSAKLHIARTVCRRAERRLVSLRCPQTISAEDYSRLLAWFNQLSYLLFLMAEAGADIPGTSKTVLGNAVH